MTKITKNMKNYTFNEYTGFSTKVLFIVSFFISGFIFNDAYAYLDPGSGSAVIQVIIGAIAGIGITLKIYWYKIKEKLSRT